MAEHQDEMHDGHPSKRSITERQKEVTQDQQGVLVSMGVRLDDMAKVIRMLLRLAWFKLTVVGVLAIVVIGVVIATTNNGNNIAKMDTEIDALGEEVDEFDAAIEQAGSAADEARAESAAARLELQEAIRLVQENPDDPTFVERVEESLEKIARIEALLEDLAAEVAPNGG